MFYSHLVEQWIRPHGNTPPFVTVVDNLTSKPMVMQLQGIGEISVPFFFIVSGFVVTPIALRQGQLKFGINRIIRVYAPMILAVVLASLMLLVHLDARPHGIAPEPVTVQTVLTNMSLANYLMVPQIALVPVAWTLIVEVMFYTLLITLIPLLRRHVWLAIALELTLVFVGLMSARQFGPVWFLVAVNISYLPILIIGQIIWASTSGKLPVWLGGLFGAAAWSLYVLADMRGMGRIDGSYNLALAFAVVLFGLGYFAEARLKERKIWIALSERSYSIYLLHMLSFAALSGLQPFLPLWVCLIIAIAATFGVVELSYRLVERPSHRLARKLSRRTKDGGERPDPMAELANEVTTRLERIPHRSYPDDELGPDGPALMSGRPRRPAEPMDDAEPEDLADDDSAEDRPQPRRRALPVPGAWRDRQPRRRAGRPDRADLADLADPADEPEQGLDDHGDLDANLSRGGPPPAWPSDADEFGPAEAGGEGEPAGFRRASDDGADPMDLPRRPRRVDGFEPADLRRPPEPPRTRRVAPANGFDPADVRRRANADFEAPEPAIADEFGPADLRDHAEPPRRRRAKGEIFDPADLPARLDGSAHPDPHGPTEPPRTRRAQDDDLEPPVRSRRADQRTGFAPADLRGQAEPPRSRRARDEDLDPADLPARPRRADRFEPADLRGRAEPPPRSRRARDEDAEPVAAVRAGDLVDGAGFDPVARRDQDEPPARPRRGQRGEQVHVGDLFAKADRFEPADARQEDGSRRMTRAERRERAEALNHWDQPDGEPRGRRARPEPEDFGEPERFVQPPRRPAGTGPNWTEPDEPDQPGRPAEPPRGPAAAHGPARPAPRHREQPPTSRNGQVNGTLSAEADSEEPAGRHAKHRA